MYKYRVNVTRVVDGDTVDVDIDLGFGMVYKKQRVRLYGIDTPESRTKDLEEKKYGKASKKFLKETLENAGTVLLLSHDKGKFGRILGELFVKSNEEALKEGTEVWEVEKSVNQHMIDCYHAVAYHGQSKEDIQEQHLINRTKIDL